METERDKYDGLLNVLRKAKPELINPKEVEESILKAVSGRVKNEFHFTEIMVFLFGWTYIPWVRRSLVTASFILVGIFVWQQRIIISEINQLNKQVNNRETTYDPSRILREKLLFNKFSDQDLNSLPLRNNLDRIKYRDIMKIIDNDPELRKIIERKISEQNNKSGFKL